MIINNKTSNANSNSDYLLTELERTKIETINFTSSTGTVNIPSGLPVGTKKLVRKLNSTQGKVTISCSGETFTKSTLASITLNSDGDFWLLEKVSATRWDLVEGKETLTTSEGESIALHTGVLVFTGASKAYSTGSVDTHTFTWTFPKLFTVVPTANSNYEIDTGQNFWCQLAIDLISTSTCVIKVAKLQIDGAPFISILCTGRWY